MKNLFYKSILLIIVFFIVNNSVCFSQAKVAGKLGGYQALMERDGYKLATPPIYGKVGNLFFFSLKPAMYKIMVVVDDNYGSNRFCIYPRLSDFSLACNDGGSENVYDGERLGVFNKSKPWVELDLDNGKNLMLDLNQTYCKSKECEWALLVYYKN